MKRVVLIDGKRPCKRCGQMLTPQELSGKSVYCPPCRRELNRAYYASNPQKYRGRTRDRRNCRACKKRLTVAKFDDGSAVCMTCAQGLGAWMKRVVDEDRNPLHAEGRRPGHVPVLCGVQERGVYWLRIRDGVDKTQLYRTAREAVAAWNLGWTVQEAL